MQMTRKTKLIHTLLINIPMCLCMSTLAMALSPGGIKPMGLLLNFLISYVISFLIGMLIPAVPLAMKVAGACKQKPGSFGFSLIIALVVNVFYVVINGLCLTTFNAVIMGGAPIQAVPGAFLGTFLPLYVAGVVVVIIFNPLMIRLAHKISKE